MTRKLAAAAGVAALLAAVYLFALGAARRAIVLAGRDQDAVEEAGPEIVLHDVEMREVREGGGDYRLSSERATYSVRERTLLAAGMTLALPEPSGEISVRAPRAAWDMDAGRIDLPGGFSAVNRAGWSASVPDGRLDLKERVMTAKGAALSGPGVSVSGINLVWRWREGTVSLDSPRTLVTPGKVPRNEG